ncbi:TIGR00730 family Rossman fold protein [Leucobacter sp. CSA1]|uniref:Cytokinin riboside 5'-monophosphate phosphoribohydrolase n=2 Tax=Leucobacter chromiisoli TaxID=2796471 RepID=A0A934Q871_9MICO|nr:TIGR00730 family Rossman fold protein [Leucobacter chromiisoli]
MLFPILRESGRAPGRIAVFTGSAAGASPAFAEAAIELASACARSGVGIVTGGGRVGLMGVIADAALRAGGEVFGVIPQPLVEGEIAHESLTRLEVVSDMHARKHRMSVLSDAFVALPGGAGTLEELFEAWTWQQLGMLAKPVALYDVEGYWQPLLGMLDRMVDEGFLSAPLRESLIVARTPDELFSALATWVPPRRK